LFAGSVGGDGSGGEVTVTQAGSVTVAGDGANGIFAQSAGGRSTGGRVSVALNSGSILATGAGSNGIFAQSIGGGGSGDVSVTIASAASLVVGGSNGGSAVRFAHGNRNTLTNYGTLTTVGGISGLAVVGGTGNETVDNHGTITGSVNLGGGVNTLTNRAEGLLNAGSSIDVGAGGEFANAGTLSLGGLGRAQTTAVTGNFTQSGTPTWLVDIRHPGTSDTMGIAGRANLAGSVTTVNINELAVPAGTGSYTLATAQGGLAGARFKFGTLFGAMPIGRTFDFRLSDTALRLTLRDSAGTFHWKGGVGGSWATPFANGVSNWTRTAGGRDYVYGTPGGGVDVVFSGSSATAMGADFAVNSLRFAGGRHVLSDSNVLTLRAGGGRGVTVDSGSSAVLGVNIVLAGNQSWLNDGALTISGSTIGGLGRNLTIDGFGTTIIAAGIQTGNGALRKRGDGVLFLTGDSGLFTGSTTVEAGRLFVDGRLGGASLEVQGGALLGGNGLVPSLTIREGGILAPGHSIGTMSVAGDVRFDPGAIYRVEVAAPTAGLLLGPSDCTVASGSLSAQGANVEVAVDGTGYRPINQYLILATGGGIGGQFSGATSNAGYLRPSLDYAGNDVYLMLRRTDVDFTSAGTRGNQTAVASALNGLVATATGGLATVINNLYDLPDDRALQAMTSMTGLLHHYVARSAFDASRTFTKASAARLGMVASGDDRLVADSGLTAGLLKDPTPGSALPAYRGWVSGLGADTAYAGVGVDAGASGDMRGLLFGFDASVARGVTLGVSGGRSWPRIGLEGLTDRATGSMTHVGAYGRYQRKRTRLDFVLGVGRFDNQTSREVTDGVTTLVARSEYGGSSVSGQIEYGYTVPLGRGFSVEPGIGFLFGRQHLDAFSEDGADVLGLSGPARREWSARVLIGSRASKSLGRAAGLRLMIEGRAAFSRDLEPLGNVFVRLRGDRSAGFRLSPPDFSRDAGVFGLGLGAVTHRGIRLFADLDTETGGAITIFRGNVGLTKTW
ncbi:MAG TPA: autotransporter domain-containing protein, partial [Vicinamibacterales bacterium]|nr:autotransporter domain-containing protein [Vicinamibacterales bacterium]